MISTVTDAHANSVRVRIHTQTQLLFNQPPYLQLLHRSFGHNCITLLQVLSSLGRRQCPHFPANYRVPTIFWCWNSRTFKDPQISFSWTNSPRKFTAWAVEQQYLMFIYATMVQ